MFGFTPKYGTLSLPVFRICVGINTVLDPDPAFQVNTGTDPDPDPALKVNTDPYEGFFMTNIKLNYFLVPNSQFFHKIAI